MTDYKEFFDNLKTDEMPVMDKILKKIEDYIEVERVSDEEALDESNHISFSLKIKEFKDSLIKISSTKDDSDISETEVYSYINGDWVNILFNNSLYLKYYGKSYFRNDNKWRKAITFGSLLGGKVNGDNLIDIINLYISKKLNFHNDEMYVYDRIRVNDMSEIDHLDDLIYHKDLKNVNDIDKNRSNKLLFDLAFNMLMLNYIYNNTTNNVKGRNDCELLDRNDQKLDSILNLNKNELFNLCVSISLRKNRPSKMSIYSRLMFNTNEDAEKRRRKLLNYFKNIKLSQPVELEFA